MQPIATQLPKIQKTSMMLPPPPTLLAKSLFLNGTSHINNNNNPILTATTTTNTFKSKQQQQNHLDEITNQVYTELLQGKVDALSTPTSTMHRLGSENGSTRSADDLGSAKGSSGIFGRLPAVTTHTVSDDDAAAAAGTKMPLIAKLKAGVKLQVTTKSDNHGN